MEGGVEKVAETNFEFTHALHAATPTTSETGNLDMNNLVFSSEEGMNYILDRAKHNGNCPRILHTSSGAVYGNRYVGKNQIPLKQDLDDIKLENYVRYVDYSVTKSKTELKLNNATTKGIVSGLNARLFAFYGPGLPTRSHYAIGNLIDQVINSKILTLNGNGMAMRSYMPGNAMAAQILYVMKTDIEGATHIGSNEGRTLGQWAGLVGSIFGKEVEILGNLDDSNDRYVPENDVRIPEINFSQDPHEVLIDWVAHLTPN
jgi:dTDP-glucose 4,6-dehydratase